MERATSLPSRPHDNTERLMAHLSRANSAKSASTSSSSSSSEEGDAKSLGVRSGKSMTSQRGRSVFCVRLVSALTAAHGGVCIAECYRPLHGCMCGSCKGRASEDREA